MADFWVAELAGKFTADAGAVALGGAADAEEDPATAPAPGPVMGAASGPEAKVARFPGADPAEGKPPVAPAEVTGAPEATETAP